MRFQAQLSPPPSNQRTLIIVIAVVLGVLVIAALRGRLHITEVEVILFLSLIPSIILHEVTHGWVALACGDDTAKRAGRLTLNPLAHIDPFGTIILPALLVFFGAPAFGWAKPVPVNVSRLRHPRNQAVLVGLAGPAMNILLALLAALLFRFEWDRFVSQVPIVSLGQLPLRILIPYLFGLANVVLAIFNLIPIPPLDGSSVVERFLPARLMPAYLRFRGAMILIPLAILLLVPSVANHLFNFEFSLWDRALGLG